MALTELERYVGGSPTAAMSESTLRPRTASELVDAAFRIFRHHFGSYALLAAVAALPGLLVNVMMLAEADWGADLSALAAQDPFSGWRMASSLLSFLTYSVVEGVYVRLTADAYDGGTPDLADVLRRTLPRIPAVIAGQVLRVLAVLIAALALIVPGLIVLVRTSFVAQANVLEGAGPVAGVGRSWALSKGNAWRVLGGIGLAWLLLFVVLFGLQMVAGVAGLLIGGTAMLMVASLVVSALGMALIYPLVPIVGTLMYFDLRIRREGLDLELMADALAPAPSRI